jgi:hypothetical protein
MMRNDPFSFARLLHPVEEESFLRHYWQQKPLVIERGEADYYSQVLSMADIDSIVAFRQLKPGPSSQSTTRSSTPTARQRPTLTSFATRTRWVTR